jgi:hypothetical protein
MRFRREILLLVAGSLGAARLGAGTIAAVPLPDPQVPGFSFPESEATLVTWTREAGASSADSAAAQGNIITHGWGLWTALTETTSQVDSGERLRVFETWYTPQEIDAVPTAAGTAALAALQRQRSPLLSFAQFEHGLEARDRELMAQTAGSETVFGYVKFDPSAASHVLAQRLLSTAALNQLMLGGAQQVPVFPSTALTLKSAFQIITTKSLVNGRYYRLNAWTGPPATPQAWAPSQWPGVVWIDVQGGGSGSGQVDREASTDGGSRTDQTTYPVSSMINHRVSAFEASQFNQLQPGSGVEAGDYAVLVAMHVAGREMTRWTWQTFWWSPTPDNPQVPSSQAIASLRPDQLAGAARNYAMAIAYDMTAPGQPNVGGQNAGSAIYAFNPYLEARFGPSSLPDSLPGDGPSGQPAANNVGVNCNCMSCHVRANYNPNNLATAPRYSGARYTDLDDPQFQGTLQVDFLWSLPELAN